MEAVNEMRTILVMVLRDVLSKIDPSGRLVLDEFKVIFSSDLVIKGLLEGVNFVGFTIGDPPEMIVAFDFEQSFNVVGKLLKLGNCSILGPHNPRDFMNSFLTEVGNVIVGQFAGRLSRVLGEEILPSVPFSIKTVDQLERILSFLGMGSRLPIFTGIIKDDQESVIDVYIIPSMKFVEKVANHPELLKGILNKGTSLERVEHAR